MPAQPVWIAGRWRPADAGSTFRATNPATGEPLPTEFPVSTWRDLDEALTAASAAAPLLRAAPPEELARFLELYAAALESRAEALVAQAHAETALPIAPRLRDVELPTTTQLRQAAAAAREGSWQQAVLDTKANIRSHYAPLGPVVAIGPNNFPFAFNGVAGGDLAAAIAAGCPVLAKGHPLHPGTTKLLAECAAEALAQTTLPPATVQMIYHVENHDGLRLVADPRVAATSFTGSRAGGLALKAAAEAAGRLIYLEMSSLNPVVLLPGALAERGAALATELADSCLAGTGQFCTSPNLVFALAGEATDAFAEELRAVLEKRPAGALFSEGGLEGLASGVERLTRAGARVLTGAARAGGEGFRYKNTLLRVSAADFLNAPGPLQHEAFGNASMLVIAQDADELRAALATLEGNLTASIYSASAAAAGASPTSAQDEALYAQIAATLRPRVGRLLNDKMPTGVALSPAMQHGGPIPATAHPGFTAVGIPRSMLRFAALECYDNVRPERLPPALRNPAPNPAMWRMIDNAWVKG